MPDAPDDLLTPKQARRIASVCLKSVYRWIRRGLLPAYRRAGTRYLVSEADVRALLRPVETPAPAAATPAALSAAASRRHRQAVANLRRMGLRV